MAENKLYYAIMIGIALIGLYYTKKQAEREPYVIQPVSYPEWRKEEKI